MSVEPNETKEGLKQPVDNGLSLHEAFSLAWEMGYLLAVPLVILALVGRLLDKHYATSPLFLLIGIVSSIIISSFLLAKRATRVIHDLAPDGPQKDKT